MVMVGDAKLSFVSKRTKYKCNIKHSSPKLLFAFVKFTHTLEEIQALWSDAFTFSTSKLFIFSITW